jgi:hypothetical protein
VKIQLKHDHELEKARRERRANLLMVTIIVTTVLGCLTLLILSWMMEPHEAHFHLGIGILAGLMIMIPAPQRQVPLVVLAIFEVVSQLIQLSRSGFDPVRLLVGICLIGGIGMLAFEVNEQGLLLLVAVFAFLVMALEEVRATHLIAALALLVVVLVLEERLTDQLRRQGRKLDLDELWRTLLR